MEVDMNLFTVWDYGVFFATLLFSTSIGVYFAVQGRKIQSEKEYLMASRNMSVLPVSLSIIASFFSAISILGTPAEMYNQGASFVLNFVGFFVACPLTAVLFIPLLYPLQLTSTYEYLELRFQSRAARLMGTFLQIVSQVIYMSIASFAPATALNLVTGFSIRGILVITALVSTFYTSLGGMRGVIWTDVFQSSGMMTGVMVIIIQGTLKVGGISEVWNINYDWGRMNIFNFSLDPTVRHSFWALSVGLGMTWTTVYGIQQAAVQRFGTLPTLKKAQLSAMLVMVGSCTISLSCCLAGVVLFAYYVTKDCDPIGKKLVANSNQLMTFFVMETLSFPCIPGIFISALFSGALSSISSALNALAAITWEDLVKPILGKSMMASKKLLIIRTLVVVYGCLGLVVSFIVQNLEGTVLQISLSLNGCVSGPTTGMFVLGALFPWANAKGAIGGALMALGISFWIVIGAFINGVPKDKFDYPNGTCIAYFKNESLDAMTTTVFSSTTLQPLTTSKISSHDEIMGLAKLYTMSYLWYSTMGIALTILLGLVISFITGPNKIEDIPTEYQIPLATRILCCLPKQWQDKLNCNRNFERPEDVLAKHRAIEVFKNPIDANSTDKKGFDDQEIEPEANGLISIDGNGTVKKDFDDQAIEPDSPNLLAETSYNIYSGTAL